MELLLDIGYKKNVLYTDTKICLPKKGVVSFIGENGSGKSTIYKTLLGMIPPLRGEIPCVISEQGVIVSDYVHIPEEVRIKDLFELIGPMKISYIQDNYNELYEYVFKLKNQKVKYLSSGQRRLIEIFAVLTTKTKFIFLDEATNALDFKNKNLFLKYIKDLSEKDVLFFHTTHDLSDVVYLGGKIYGLFKDKKKILEYKGEINLDCLHKFLEF